MPGEEDINILGETGAEFAARKIAEDPGAARLYRRLGGWQRMEPQKAARLLVPLARVPGMSALTLRATAAPGWAGEKPGGGGIVYSGYLGYGVAARLACIRSQGYDPIDVAAYPDALGALRVPLEPPMFPSNNGSGISHDILQDLCDYRLRENYQGLGAIYAALRRNAPDLPLYLGDRPSAYKDTHFSWYSLWDAAEHIPVNANSADESEVLKAAYAVSPEPLRNYNASNGDPIELARAIDNTAQDAAKHWRGLTLDLVEMKPSDALRMLKGLQSLYARTVSQ